MQFSSTSSDKELNPDSQDELEEEMMGSSGAHPGGQKNAFDFVFSFQIPQNRQNSRVEGRGAETKSEQDVTEDPGTMLQAYTSLSEDSVPAQAVAVFSDLVTALCWDVAADVHRETYYLPFLVASADKEIEALLARAYSDDADRVAPFAEPQQVPILQCPFCSRGVATSRFAPHLQRCMNVDGVRNNGSSKRSRLLAKRPRNQDSVVLEPEIAEPMLPYIPEPKGATPVLPEEEVLPLRPTSVGPGDPLSMSVDMPMDADGKEEDSLATGTESLAARPVSGMTSQKRRTHLARAVLSQVLPKLLYARLIGDMREPWNINTQDIVQRFASSVSEGADDSLMLVASVFRDLCGVVSAHTGKMCLNTINCRSHTVAQRSKIRQKIAQCAPTFYDLLATAPPLEQVELIDTT